MPQGGLLWTLGSSAPAGMPVGQLLLAPGSMILMGTRDIRTHGWHRRTCPPGSPSGTQSQAGSSGRLCRAQTIGSSGRQVAWQSERATHSTSRQHKSPSHWSAPRHHRSSQAGTTCTGSSWIAPFGWKRSRQGRERGWCFQVRRNNLQGTAGWSRRMHPAYSKIQRRTFSRNS